jgi:PIN domain nuclease of toxin-antitoxin system
VSLLLDTHALIWALEAPERLPTTISDLLDQADAVVFASAASIWEIAIKVKLRRLVFPLPATTRALSDAALHELQVTVPHALATADLPMIHRDPFDRLLIAQARHEGLTLVTRDPLIHRYPVDTLWD